MTCFSVKWRNASFFILRFWNKKDASNVNQPRFAAKWRLKSPIMKEKIDNLSKIEYKHHDMDEESVALESTDWYKKMSAEMTPGKAIRADRGLRGWTQNVLAQKLGISIQNLSAMEHDRRPVSKKMAAKLSQVFGVPPETYFKF